MASKLIRRPSPATIIALAALFVALDGPAHAQRLIDGGSIRKGSVTGRAIKDRSVEVRDLARAARSELQQTPASSITSLQIADGQVHATDVADRSIGATKIGAEAIRSEHVANGTLTSLDLGTSSVDADEVAPNAIRASEIADNSVDGGEVINGGLQAVDVGSFAGSFALDIPQRAVGECFTSPPVAATPNALNQNISDDVVVVSPGSNWPAGYTITARPEGTAELVLTACRLAVAPVDDPPPTTIRYVTFDI